MHCFCVLLLVFCLAGTCFGLAFDPRNFTRTQVLREGILTIWWNADVANNELTIAVEAKYVTGFVGIGISANGGMYGADIAVFWKKDSSYVIEDRFASGFFEPAADSVQDTVLLAHEVTATETSYVYQRKLNSCDKQDFPIDDRGTNVIFAFSNSTTLQYHGPNNRGSANVNFIHVEVVPDLPASAQTLDVVVSDWEIPAVETTYLCMNYNFPVISKQHIIAGVPIVTTPNHVHHMVLFQCATEPNTTIGVPFVCQGMATSCTTPLLLWARGTGSTFLPLTVGLPIGTVDSPKYTMLQIHYNNPDAVAGLRDSSGFRVSYTSELRQYDMGILIQGVPAQILTLPVSTTVTETGVCPAECLATALPSEGVNLLAVGFHMHKFGRKMSMQLFRGGKEVKPVGTLDWFNFNYQTGYKTEAIKLLPTDRLRTTCVWDTSASTGPVLGGESTSNEMCYSFLHYYPRQPLVVCLDVSTKFPGYSLCANSTQLNAPPSSWKIGQGIIMFDSAKSFSPYQETCDPSKGSLSSASSLTTALVLLAATLVIPILV